MFRNEVCYISNRLLREDKVSIIRTYEADQPLLGIS